MTNTTPNGAKHASAAPTGEAQVDPSATPPPALSDTQSLLSELARMKVLFQARALAAIIGVPQP